MFKWLRKVSALFVAAVMVLAFSTSALATVQYETVTAPRVRDGGVRELGSVLIRMQPLLYREHAAWVSLPRDFTIEQVSLVRATYEEGQTTRDLEVELHDELGKAPLQAEPRDNGFKLRIPTQVSTDGEVILILSFDRVDVPSNFRGDIMVSFEGLTGQFTGGTASSALVPGRPVEDPDEVEEPEEPEEPEPPVEPDPPVEEPEVRNVILLIDQRIAHLDARRLEMDVAPFIQDGRTFVPLRFVAEAFGAELDWTPRDAPTEVVTLTKGDLRATLNIGSPLIQITENGESRTVTADVAPQIVQDRTFLPLRAVGEILGAEFDWGPKEALTQWVSFALE